MYKCFSMKKFIKFSLIGISFTAVMACIINFSEINWSALNINPESGIFLPVIMYHSIVDDTSKANDYTVTPDTIENDFKYLKNHGYQAILTNDLVNYINDSAELPQKPVMITLDDGFYNNIYYLVPILEKYDMKVVISVVGNFSEAASERDAHVPEYSYLTWDDISEISSNPRIEIGNHTYNMHSTSSRKGCSKLYSESDEEYSEVLINDIGMLQNTLQNNCGITPVSFAYPFGYISRESIPVLKKLGFQATFTCYEKPNYIIKNPDCLFGINRYNRASGISTEKFMEKALQK